MFSAPLGGFLGDRLSCRATVILGGLLSAAGLVLSSFASSLESLYIFLGVLTGKGTDVEHRKISDQSKLMT